jgi:2-polyprenyl-3-methyl-5-hydroxy-6-metoxy-1,4-benzoquinol methylase
MLTQRGYAVTAIEGDPGLAAMARGKCREVVVADLDRPMPNLQCPFDEVVCADVLEHLKNPLVVLLEITRLLKPNESIIISVPNIAHLLGASEGLNTPSAGFWTPPMFDSLLSLLSDAYSGKPVLRSWN